MKITKRVDEPALNPQSTPYSIIGGEAKVHALVTRFYDLMDEDPDFYSIRKLHPESLDGSREKLFMFLVGWTGGPQLYINAYGHPRLRARHMPFAIDETARDQWMFCMTTAMQQLQLNGFVMAKMTEQLHGVADFMRNQ